MHWLKARGLLVPKKSSCRICPFHSDAYWREMKAKRPGDFACAAQFDRRLREAVAPLGASVTGQVFLHRSCRPLDKVDLTSPEDQGQLSMFREECDGVCGV